MRASPRAMICHSRECRNPDFLRTIELRTFPICFVYSCFGFHACIHVFLYPCIPVFYFFPSPAIDTPCATTVSLIRSSFSQNFFSCVTRSCRTSRPSNIQLPLQIHPTAPASTPPASTNCTSIDKFTDTACPISIASPSEPPIFSLSNQIPFTLRTMNSEP